MENEKGHVELMTTLAVFQATMEGKLNAINSHLATLNGQTSKNTGAVAELQEQDRNIMRIIYDQGTQLRDSKQEEKNREDEKEKRQDGWKSRFLDLLFGTLKWIIPAIIVGVLANGISILKFLGLSQ